MPYRRHRWTNGIDHLLLRIRGGVLVAPERHFVADGADHRCAANRSVRAGTAHDADAVAQFNLILADLQNFLFEDW